MPLNIKKHGVKNIFLDNKRSPHDIKNISLVKFLTKDEGKKTLEVTILAEGVFSKTGANWEDLSKSIRINLFIHQFHNKAVTPKLFITYNLSNDSDFQDTLSIKY